MDTKHVHVLSTVYFAQDVVTVRRKNRDGTRNSVQRPRAISEYTRRMTGVDRFDQHRTCYSVSRRSRKWWMRIFYFIIDSAVVNAHILYQSVHPESVLTLLQFRTALFRKLCNTSFRRRRSPLDGNSFTARRPRQSAVNRKKPGVPDDIRLHGQHMPEKISSFRRCRMCSTRNNNKRSRTICSTCRVALCIECFAAFHVWTCLDVSTVTDMLTYLHDLVAVVFAFHQVQDLFCSSASGFEWILYILY